MGTLFLSIILLSIGLSSCEEQRDEREGRFSIFQIIKFENAPCKGSKRNGTCFTAAECKSAGGTEDGKCADGFGVCCHTILSEGGSTSLNQSYIYMASSSAVTAGGRTYSICPSSSDVCRIRFDFTTFTLAPPAIQAVEATYSASVVGEAIGDCTVDQFSITSPNGGSPVICGENKGQHMILDSDGTSCSTVNLGIGGGTVSRQWDIMVTQYKCGEEAGGPSGCLQWHMTATGKIRSFNFPDQANNAAVKDTTTHLSNQVYNICIRKPASKNRICYIPCTNINAAISGGANKQASFGISITATKTAVKTANSAQGTDCADDYLQITGAQSVAIAAIDNAVSSALSKFCGRQFQTTADKAFADESVCTKVVPFQVGVNFGADEVAGGSAAKNGEANTDETEVRPGGTIGFSLCYTTA